MAKGYDLDDIPSNGGGRRRRPGDSIDEIKLGEKFSNIRLLGETFLYGGHWVKTKKRDGSMASFYIACSAFDPESGRRDSTLDCPWCGFERDHAHDEKEKAKVRFAVDAYVNVISRRLEKSKPEDIGEPNEIESESGFKQKGSDLWTPVQVLKMGNALIRSFKELKQLNVHDDESGNSKEFAVSHAKYGCDVMVKKASKDSGASPANMFSVQKGDHSPLKKSQRAYPLYDLSNLQDYPTAKEAAQEFESWSSRMSGGKKQSSRSDDDGDDEFDTPRKKRKFSEESEDEIPRSKARKIDLDSDEEADEPPKKKRRPVEDDDEVEAPRKKRPKPVDEDEEDEDF